MVRFFEEDPTTTILTPSATLATVTASSTPFQPAPITPTSSITPSPTATFTSTPTLTATATVTHTASPYPTQTPLPPATNTPPPPVEDIWPPAQAMVNGVPGHGMHYGLDCETRSAVDLAAFFGYSINHEEFLGRLPYTDDPETGYVGDYRAAAGNIPPYSYGVHAPPVAALLRDYGVNATAHRYASLDTLKAEIASGRPVMIWVVGSVQYGTPVEYTAESTGNTTIVAAYEHTVLVVGYDENYITIQDGWNVYKRSISQFERSWGTLANMAVTVQ